MAEGLAIEPFLTAQGLIVDVRTPEEFAQGHIPGARNLPLFNGAERAAVGTCYRQQGRSAAINLGLQLVGPRLAGLAEALQGLAGPERDGSMRLHCWRGGLRSSSTAWLAQLVGLQVQLLEGGYKSFRRWVLECFERPWPIRLLGGRTGTGKTELLLELAERGVAVVDLEGLAHHRGSSFGGLGLPPQPSNEHYENRLATALHGHGAATEIWLEAESVQVGRCRIPAGLWRQMQQAPLLEIQRPLASRINRLVDIYGLQGQRDLHDAVLRIARRLGPQRTTTALEAIERQDWSSACSALLDYYDRCYDHELQRHAAPSRSLELGDCTAADAATRLLSQGLVRDPHRIDVA